MRPETNKEIKKTLSKSEKGFSLLEILIALALLAGAGTFVAGKMFESMHKGRVSTAKTQMGNIANMLRSYKADCNVYPTTEQGLEALQEKPTTGREKKRTQDQRREERKNALMTVETREEKRREEKRKEKETQEIRIDVILR